MELQLGKQKHMIYARVFDRTEEETCSADSVVPDALGDIGTILVTEGTFCLWNLDFSEKSAQIEGSIAADVVYAEEDGTLSSFPVELPVKVRISGETLSPDVRPWLRCTLIALDARAVNSRKVRVTARLSLCLRAYRETELVLTDRIEGDGGTVFTRTETLRVQVLVSVDEKTFTVSETHRFTAGQPEGDRLLCHTETVLLDDVSAVGSRVILQGRVCASVSYLRQGQMCPAVETFETPFSQMLDCPSDAAPCLMHTTVNLTAAYLNVSAAADGAALEAEYHLVAQTVCLADTEADCVTDAYCNTADLALERETVPAGAVQPGEPLCLTAEGTLACEAASLTVMYQRAIVCGLAEDGCDVLVRLLVTDAEQRVSCMEKRLHLPLEPENGAHLELLSVQPEEPAVTVAADGFLIRVTVTARTAVLQESEFRQVTGAAAQERACPYTSVPSLTIVRWGGENLWSLAKRYCSSEQLIRETNGLTDDTVMSEPPQYLLIPKTQA